MLTEMSSGLLSMPQLIVGQVVIKSPNQALESQMF